MKRIALVACAVALAGCSGQNKPAAEPKVEYFKPDPATAAKVSGTVRFTGKPPAAKVISMNAEEACEKLNPQPVSDRTVILGKNGALANALVYIKSGLEGKQFEPPKEAVVLDQKGCMFVPRVVPLRTNQTLSVKNSDPVSHNIHPRPRDNREWNQQHPPGAPDLQRRFARPEIRIPVRCNVHSWMRAWIAVLDHPWFAVTKEDGSFEWPSVPPGKYTVAVWHEMFGEVTQELLLTPSAAERLNFQFAAP